MKNLKKVVALLIVAVLVMTTVVACGNKKEDDATTFKIGGIGPLTGGAAVYGIAVENGAKLAVDEINKAGGVNGYQIEFKMQDDEHDAEKAVNAYNTLKDWGMKILMGTVTSDPCKAVVAKTYADKMFQLTPSGSAVESIMYDNAFRVCYSDPNQGFASAEYIGKNNLAQKVAVIYNSSDVYSTGIYENFKKKSSEYNFKIVAEQAFTADSATDFTVQLQKAKEAGADMVFLPIYYEAASLILTQADKMGYAPTFFGCDGMDGILSMKGFDTKLAEGLMLLTPFAADGQDDLTKKFVTAYKDAYKSTPIQFAADAYDAIYIIKAALEKANAKPNMKTSELCEILKKAMVEIEFKGLTTAGEVMTWSKDGEPNKAPLAVVIKNGVYTSMEFDK